MANLPAGCPLEAYRKVIEPGQESGDTSMVTLAGILFREAADVCIKCVGLKPTEEINCHPILVTVAKDVPAPFLISVTV